MADDLEPARHILQHLGHVRADVLGTIDQVDEEGERSWTVTLVVLEEDLD